MGQLQKLLATATLAIAPFLSTATHAAEPGKAEKARTHLIAEQEKKLKKSIDKWNKTLTKHNDADKVDLKIIIDKEYATRYPDWKQQVKDNIAQANAGMRKHGIAFDIDEVEYFDSEDFMGDARYYLAEMTLENPPAGNDAVVAFSGEPRANSIVGVAFGLGDYALITASSAAEDPRVTLHELSHLFGTDDYAKGHPQFFDDTVMSYLYGYNGTDLPTKFDAANAARAEHNKDRAWPSRYPWPATLRERIKRVHTYLAAVPAEQREALKKAYILSTVGSPDFNALFFVEDEAKKHPEDANLQYACAMVKYNEAKGRESALAKRQQLDALEKLKAFTTMDTSKTPGCVIFDKADALNTYAWDLATEVKDKLPEALAAAQEAVKLAPDNIYFLDTLGVVLHKSGKADEALKPLTKARDIIEKRGPIPDDAGILRSLLKIQLKRKDYEGYCRTADLLIKADEFDGVPYNNYAWHLTDDFSKGYEKAVRLAKKSITWSGERDFNINTLGWALYKSGKVDESLDTLVKAARLNLEKKKRYYELDEKPRNRAIEQPGNPGQLLTAKPEKPTTPEREYLDPIAEAYHTALASEKHRKKAMANPKEAADMLMKLVEQRLLEGKDLKKTAAIAEDTYALAPKDKNALFGCARANQRYAIELYQAKERGKCVTPFERSIELGKSSEKFRKKYLGPTYLLLITAYHELKRENDAERVQQAYNTFKKST